MSIYHLNLADYIGRDIVASYIDMAFEDSISIVDTHEFHCQKVRLDPSDSAWEIVATVSLKTKKSIHSLIDLFERRIGIVTAAGIIKNRFDNTFIRSMAEERVLQIFPVEPENSVVKTSVDILITEDLGELSFVFFGSKFPLKKSTAWSAIDLERFCQKSSCNVESAV